MPWKETCPVHERLKLISQHGEGHEGVADLARAFGVSRKTVYKWLERYAAEGPAGLDDKSRATHTHPNAMTRDVEEALKDERRQHPTWGPKKLIARLRARDPDLQLPAPSTCGEMLGRAGMVPPRRRRSPAERKSDRPGGYAAPNAVWCADFKGQFRTLDGALCYPLTITDGFSRYLIRCQGLTNVRETGARPVFEAAFREHGLPEAIRTDNGAPFASRGLHGLSRLSAWWLKLGIEIERIVPGHPEQNGRHERMHRTLKRETAYPPKGDMQAQQLAFDEFQTEYNVERPHESLGQKPPASEYERSTRPYPDRLEDPVYPAHFEKERVAKNGTVYLRGCAQLFVSQALVGELIGLEPVDEDLWSLHFGRSELATVDGQDGNWRVVPHASGPAGLPLAWWLAPIDPTGGPQAPLDKESSTASEGSA